MVALFGLPEEVKFCSKCVISNQRPQSTVEFKSDISEKKKTIHFDESGVCDACKFAVEKDDGINWDSREEDLWRLCDKYRRKTGYDVIIPGSGGKDSAYTSHILKYKYGMNPLTVTWAPHLYTDIGWENFTNWTHVGGMDNILFTPNGKLHRILTREAFVNLLHPFQPFIVGQRIIGPSIAKKFGVELVMYGENQAEYGNVSSENSNPKMQEKFFTSNDLDAMKLGGLSIKDLMAKYNLEFSEFVPYLPVSDDSGQKTEVHYLGYYLKWDPQECFYYASENTGFKPNPNRTEGTYSKYSSIDDKIDPFHYYTTLIKFGLGRASYDASQEIRNGKISREEGVNLVELYDGEFPNRFFPEFLEYVDLDEGRFQSIVDTFRSPHLWKRVQDKWELKNPVWH
jgi:N-acetyl sugar amidotransferase